MNRFTKASIKLYERWAKVLPEMFNRLDNLKNVFRIHENNPFIDQDRAGKDIKVLEMVCEEGYEVFRKLQNRLWKQGLIHTDPWKLVKKRK